MRGHDNANRVRSPGVLAFGAALTLFGVGCSEDFDPYNELLGFRVLAVRAERPTLRFGEATALDALVYTPDGAPVEYAWSWCPSTGGASNGYQCVITRDEFQATIDEAVGPGAVVIPPYELSTTATAAFSYDLPPLLFSGICEALKTTEIPAFVDRPACNGIFDITVRLVARSGDREIVTVKSIGLVYDEVEDSAVNTNPEIFGVRYRAGDQPAAANLTLPPTSTTATTTPTVTFARDKEYVLSLDVPDSASEAYTETIEGGSPTTVREVLLLTWFIEGGEMDSQRTTFIPGETALETATENRFTTPRAADYPSSSLKLLFVVLDGRGGTTWTERTIALEE